MRRPINVENRRFHSEQIVIGMRFFANNFMISEWPIIWRGRGLVTSTEAPFPDHETKHGSA